MSDVPETIPLLAGGPLVLFHFPLKKILVISLFLTLITRPCPAALLVDDCEGTANPTPWEGSGPPGATPTPASPPNPSPSLRRIPIRTLREGGLRTQARHFVSLRRHEHYLQGHRSFLIEGVRFLAKGEGSWNCRSPSLPPAPSTTISAPPSSLPPIGSCLSFPFSPTGPDLGHP